MKKISLQWRLTIAMAMLVAIVCLLLTVFINRSAALQLVVLENAFIEIAPFDGESMSLSINLSELFPELASQFQNSRSTIHIQSVLILSVVIILAAVITYFIAGKALSPLRAMTQRIEQVQTQNLSQPLDVPHTGDELARLAQSFNGMLGRLSKSFAIQKQFSANAAHELRTPLAVMQAKLDILNKDDKHDIQYYEQTVQQLNSQTTRLSRLVTVLLEMTELQTAQQSDTISLGALTDEVFCDLAELAEAKGVTLQRTGNEIIIIGNDTLIYRAIFNMVENGIKYNGDGGKVLVSINKDEEHALITVTDTGIGIDRTHWEDIFTPFFRTDKSRSRKMGGAGLGLALVSEVASLHGGEIRVVKSTSEGTKLQLILPLSLPA